MDALLQFYLNPRNELFGQTVAFFELCFVPIALSIVIGVAIGILVYRNAWLSFIAINLSNLIRAVPVLAALFIFVPIFKIGFLPAAIALTMLGIPPVLLNTYVGLRGIDPGGDRSRARHGDDESADHGARAGSSGVAGARGGSTNLRRASRGDRSVWGA